MAKKDRLLGFDRNWLCDSLKDSPMYSHLKVFLEPLYDPKHELWLGEECRFMVTHGLRHILNVFRYATRLYYDVVRNTDKPHGNKGFLKEDVDKICLILSIWLHDWGMAGPELPPYLRSLPPKKRIEKFLKILNETIEVANEKLGEKINKVTNLEFDCRWIRPIHSLITYFNITKANQNIRLDILGRKLENYNRDLEDVAIICLFHRFSLDKLKGFRKEYLSGLCALLSFLDGCDENWQRLTSMEHVDKLMSRGIRRGDEVYEKIDSAIHFEDLRLMGISKETSKKLGETWDKGKFDELLGLLNSLLNTSRNKPKLVEFVKDVEYYINSFVAQFEDHIEPKLLIKDVYFKNGEIILVPRHRLISEENPAIQKTVEKIRDHLRNYQGGLEKLGLRFTEESVRLWRQEDGEPEEKLEVPEIPKLTDIDEVFEVDSVEKLVGEYKGVAGKSPFMENPLGGKFRDKKLCWSALRDTLYFPESVKIEIKPQRVVFITGKTSIGKTTFLLYWLENYLASKDMELTERERRFEKIAFINPGCLSEELDEESRLILAFKERNIHPRNTLIAIDALIREGDVREIYKKKCESILKLAFQKGFGVLATLTDSEYEEIKKLCEKEWKKHAHFVEETSIKFDEEATGIILERCLESELYKDVKYNVSKEQRKDFVKRLHKKIKGNPFGIHFLLSRNKQLSMRLIDELPYGGLPALVWYTIYKDYQIKGDKVILSILTLLSKYHRPFSREFLDFVTEWAIKEFDEEDITEDVRRKMEILEEELVMKTRIEYDSVVCDFVLDKAWKDSIDKWNELETDYLKKFVNDAYVGVKNNFNAKFGSLKQKLKERLEIIDPGDIFLCIDLAKLDGKEKFIELEFVTNGIFLKDSYFKGNEFGSKYVKHSLIELWKEKAMEFMGLHKLGEECECLENALKIDSEDASIRFLLALVLKKQRHPEKSKEHLRKIFAEVDKKGIISKKARHFYTTLLTKELDTLDIDKEKDKVKELKEEIEGQWLELELLDPDDPITFQSRALFYKKIHRYEKAEKHFENAYNLDKNHVPTLQAYAIFCKEMGNRLWGTEREKANEYFERAEKLFRDGRMEASRTGFSEKKLLNAFAIFLADWAGKIEDSEERIRLDEETDDIFTEILEKYPDHVESRNAYANFLIRVGKWLRDTYPQGKNFDKAFSILTQTLQEYGEDPVAQNILGRLYYLHYKKYGVAEKLLRDSAKNQSQPFPNHRYIVYHELGKLYMKWADELKRGMGYEDKLKSAKECLDMAESAPRNLSTYFHISRVCVTLAFFYSKFRLIKEKVREYIKKARDFAQKAEWVPKYWSVFFVNDATELLEGSPEIALFLCEQAVDMDRMIDAINYWPYFLMGKCNSKLGNVKEAIEDYRKCAEIQNTKKGYGSVRNDININIKKGFRREIIGTGLWKDCIETMLWCSKKTIEAGTLYWKDYTDCGADWLERGKYLLKRGIVRDLKQFENLRKDGLECFENAIKNFEIAEELFKNGKLPKTKLNWVYWRKGDCYKEMWRTKSVDEKYEEAEKDREEAIRCYKEACDLESLLGEHHALMARKEYVRNMKELNVRLRNKHVQTLS